MKRVIEEQSNKIKEETKGKNLRSLFRIRLGSYCQDAGCHCARLDAGVEAAIKNHLGTILIFCIYVWVQETMPELEVRWAQWLSYKSCLKPLETGAA